MSILQNFCTTTHRERLVQCKKPNQGFLKIYMDGSSLGNPRRTSFRELIQDEHCKQIVGILGFLEISTIMHVELAAIYQGLKVAASSGDISFELESDSLEVVLLTRDNDMSTHVFGALIEDIQKIFTNKPTYQISHIHREANSYVNSLAKMGAHNAALLYIWEEAPLPYSYPCLPTTPLQCLLSHSSLFCFFYVLSQFLSCTKKKVSYQSVVEHPLV